MNTDRRNFIKTSAIAAGVIGLGPLTHSCCNSGNTSKEVALNLSFQEGIAPGSNLNEKLDYMENLGIVGLEPGGGNLANRVNDIQQALRGRNIKVSVICAGFSGWQSAIPKIRHK